MTIGERILKVRKENHLTQEAFGAKINLKRTSITAFELGNTSPSDRTIQDICDVFHVNESWLRTGEGDPNSPIDKDEESLTEMFSAILREKGGEDFKAKFLKAVINFDEKQWDALNIVLRSLADASSSADPDAVHSARLHSDLDAQLDAQKNPPEGSEESSSTSSSMV